MFDWVEKHKRWIQIVLLILIVPSFAFFGINYYFGDSADGSAVATVAGTKISPNEFDQALRERQDQLRQQLKEKADPAILDSNELRNSVVNQLVDRRALLAHAFSTELAVPDDQVRKVISEVPYFKDDADGKFSAAKYEEILRRQGMTPVMFEEKVRQDLRVAQVRDPVSGSTVVAGDVVDRLGRIRGQEREISEWVFTPDAVFEGVSVSDADVKKFYDTHQNDFRIPERVRVEYVSLTADDVTRELRIPEAELRAAYEKNAAQYGKPEERRSSHILIAVPKDASAQVKADARKQAEALVAEVRAAPKQFADLARKHSKDPGSAANGGDLGFNARGTMVKAFDDALFALEVGKVAGPVETQYGFHVIRLDAIKAAEMTPFEKVRGEIEADLLKPRAGKAFADAAENLQNLVYEQSDSLKPASEALELKIQTSDWITRGGGGQPAALVKPQMLAKIFSEEAIKQKRNTDAIEVEPNTVMAARVIDHRESSILPFEDVKGDVRNRMRADKARELAVEQGKAALARLQKGDAAGARWSVTTRVSLQTPGTLQVEAARDVFAADAAKLPVYVGVPTERGTFVIYRVSRVIEAPALTADERKALSRQVAQLAAQQQFDAYVQAVKAAAGVSIDLSKVEKKAQQ
jgi:peptidyl-prolyl cis-trans isomerase D